MANKNRINCKRCKALWADDSDFTNGICKLCIERIQYNKEVEALKKEYKMKKVKPYSGWSSQSKRASFS